jgi:glutaredoxin
MSGRRLVVYIRGYFCPDVQRACDFLEAHRVPHDLIDAADDDAARERVRAWTGHLSFPTLVIAEGDAVVPVDPPMPLSPGQSPRDVDRGTMITEASTRGLETFLRRHGFLE